MFCAVAISLSLSAAPLCAQRGTEAIVVDGQFDEASWELAEPAVDFLQTQPDDGAVGSERTEVRLLYDDTALYIGFRNFDSSPSEIVGRLARRDDETSSDRVEIGLDTRGDHTSAFHFSVSASNVQRDAIRTGDDAYEWAWDAVWRSSVRRETWGWSAEIKIPLAVLRFDKGQESNWRLQLKRFIARKNELQLWAYQPRDAFGELGRFRPIKGLAELPTPRGLVLRPFAMLALSALEPHVEGEGAGLRWLPSAGFDVRYGLTPGLSLDATVLPDFGQVNADPALLNLTTFEVQFPERRPFFLESVDLYQLRDAYGEPTSTQLFYSRRIGARPIFDFGGARQINGPEVARIWGAVKLSGRIGESISLGLLDAVTANEEAVVDDGQTTSRRTVAPLSNYTVARASGLLGHGLRLGGTVTDVHRFEEPGAMVSEGDCANPAFRPDPSGRCSRDASSVEADLSWSGFEGDWMAAVHGIASRIHAGGAMAQRDGTLISTGDLGGGMRAEVAKAGGLLVGQAMFETYSPRLDLNEVGYLQRQNQHHFFSQIGAQVFKGRWFQKTKTSVELFGRNSWDGAAISRGVYVNNLTQWSNFWVSWLELQWNGTGYDNRELRDGTRFERPWSWGIEAELLSNPAKPISFDATALLQATRVGASLDSGFTISAQATDRWRISLAPSLLRVTGDIRAVDTSGPRYVFGLQDALGIGLTLRSNFTVTPAISLQLYAQLFFADVRYRSIYEADRSGSLSTVSLSQLRSSALAAGQYDDHSTALNVNAVFRWEVWPGSILYLVYTRAQAGSSAIERHGSRVELGDLGHLSAENTILLKASYYFAK